VGQLLANLYINPKSIFMTLSPSMYLISMDFPHIRYWIFWKIYHYFKFRENVKHNSILKNVCSLMSVWLVRKNQWIKFEFELELEDSIHDGRSLESIDFPADHKCAKLAVLERLSCTHFCNLLVILHHIYYQNDKASCFCILLSWGDQSARNKTNHILTANLRKRWVCEHLTPIR